MIILENVKRYSEERGLSYADSLQTFMQILVLKNISLESARLFGGTALVLGFGNPRFSEDLDFTQVPHPPKLANDLARGGKELEAWFGVPARLTPPKVGKPTWRIVCTFGPAESVRLHVDSQKYPAHTRRPMIIRYPGISTFVIESLALEEIMAEKIVALAFRRYLGGRDLFDLWFHWLSEPHNKMVEAVRGLLDHKLRERRIGNAALAGHLSRRLSTSPNLERARAEWKRYLPPNFQKPTIAEEIMERCRALPELLLL